MSQADIDKLHGHLTDLNSESARQVKGSKQINESAVKMLAAVEKRLAEIHPMSESDEYQHLMQEKGVLQQVIGQNPR
jgi:hypothetical protein